MIEKNIVSYIISFSCCIVLSCSKKDAIRPPAFNPAPLVKGKTYSADEVLAFKEMTLYATDVIIKLPKQVSFYLVDTGYAYMTNEIDSILHEINLLLDTNLVLTRTGSSSKSDIQIYLTDRNTYIAAEPAATLQKHDYTGLTFLHWNLQGNIERGSVFVDMDRTKGDTIQQRHLIHHEMMHALGFYSHVTLPGTYSVLFYEELVPEIADYTSFDKRMMLLLYNPSISAGMNEVDFNEAIKNL